MFCKYCGMESTTTDKCSWCRKVLTLSAPAVQQPPASHSAPPVQSEPEALATLEMPAITVVEAAPPSVAPPAPVVTTAPPASAVETPPASRPSIAVRRPGTPRPSVGEPAVNPSASTPAPVAAPTPVPSVPQPEPPVTKPTPPAVQRPAAPRPVAPVMAPAASAIQRQGQSQAPVPSEPKPRPAAPLPASAVATPSAATATAKRPSAPVAKPAPTPVLATATATVSGGGLAEGVALGNRPASAPQHHAPELGAVQTVKSKYYQDVVVDPVSGTHYDLMTSKPMTAPQPAVEQANTKKEPDLVINWITTPEVPDTNLLTRFSAVFLGILLLTYFVANVAAPAYWLALLLCNFGVGILLPVLQVAPWHDEDSEDIGWLFLGTLVGGPVVALCAYGAASMLRREFNAGVLGCLITSALSRITVELAAGNPTMSSILVPWSGGSVNMLTFLVSWAGLITMVGWIFGNIFHKFDE